MGTLAWRKETAGPTQTDDLVALGQSVQRKEDGETRCRATGVRRSVSTATLGGGY